MEGFLPATKTGGEALAAADPKIWQAGLIFLDSCKFYPTAKAEWADVKQGVINARAECSSWRRAFRNQLDDLQAEIAG